VGSKSRGRLRVPLTGTSASGVGYCIAPPRTGALDERTLRALNAINRSFYREAAAAFSASREEPWPGWTRLAELVEAQGLGPRLELLDVGCGNGRFGRFLAQRAPQLRYLGIDASPELLALAEARGPIGAASEFRRLDLVEDDLDACLGAQRFSLVALFGLLHHLPGAARRRALLHGLAARLRPGGLLALTLWRFEAFRRFRERIVPWETHNRAAAAPIDPAQLEPGDHLLPWGPDGIPRYCHFADEDETRELLAGLPCQTLARYDADGREGALNRYLVLRAGA
jgi:SAM-dependent methyltransferase